MQGKVERSDSQTVYVGIDVAKHWLDVALYPVNTLFRVANNKKGHKELLKMLAPYEVAIAVFEATGKQHCRLHAFLHTAGVPAVAINPYRSRKFADIMGRLAKTDTIDARLLALFAARQRPAARAPAGESLLELKELVSAREAAMGEKTAIANRRSAALSAALRRELGERLCETERHIARLDRMIAATIAADPELARRYEILMSVPGIGAVAASGLTTLLDELGDCTDKQIAALVGVAPMNWDSGQMRGKRVIKGGRASVRKLLYMPAMVAATRNINPDLAALYRRLIARAKPAKVAIVAVMRKLVIIANALVAQDRLWQPQKP